MSAIENFAIMASMCKCKLLHNGKFNCTEIKNVSQNCWIHELSYIFWICEDVASFYHEVNFPNRLKLN